MGALRVFNDKIALAMACLIAASGPTIMLCDALGLYYGETATRAELGSPSATCALSRRKPKWPRSSAILE